MESKTGDIRAELEAMIMEIQNKIVSMKEARSKIDEDLKDADSALAALRTVYEIEARRFGETRVPFWGREGTPSRFAGMKLTDALAVIRKEKPEINKQQALKILKGEGFDFRGKRPLPAVHFAWVALSRRKKVR